MRVNNWLEGIKREIAAHIGRRRGTRRSQTALRSRQVRQLRHELLEERAVMYGGQGLQFNITPTASVPLQARDAFQVAANQWSAILADDIVVNINIDFTPNAAGIGQALNASGIKSLTEIRDALSADQKSLSDISAVAHLPAGSSAALYTTDFSTNLPRFDNNATDNNTYFSVSRANAKALGLRAANDPATDGTIRFLSTVAFDYDPSNGISAGRYDFVGVAMHEIGHLLGFLSGADAVDFKSLPNGPGYNATADQDNQIVAKPLDLFRFSAGSLAVGADFDLRADKAVKYFSIDGGATQLASFSTGRYHGDGNENQHWKDNLGIGVMDPSVALGEYADVTTLDAQALDVIGWDLAMDYGDAPDSGVGAGIDDYPTTLADNGPRHIMFSPSGLVGDPVGAPHVFLGTGVDPDLNGQPTATADGDDNDGVDDETGIAVFPTLVSGTTVSLSIASSATAAKNARLNYFFDFNRNGVFNDLGETFSVTLNSPLQSVLVIIPAEASLGDTHARFRISTAGGLGPTGPANDGEVEDYRVSIVAPSAPLVGNLTTLEDTLSNAIVIDRAPNQGITHFKISGIAGGTLFQSDGATPIQDGDFISFAQGQAGVKFLPSANSTAAGQYDVESSQNGSTVAAQSGKSTSTITVTPVDDAPTSLTLSNPSIAENQPAGTTVGMFLTADPDAGDTFTYTLTSGAGDTDNGQFTIDADGHLTTSTTFDYEAKNSYAVRIRSTDAGGLFVEQTFLVLITDVSESGAELSGTSGDDHFTVSYSGANFTVTLATNGGAPSLLGTYPLGMSLVVNGLGGNDQVTLALTPSQLGDLTTADILLLKDYLAAPTGKTLALVIPHANALQALDIEIASLAVNDDGAMLDISACMPSIFSDAQIQVGGDATDDVIYGTNLADLIFGQGGNDSLYGLDGSDCLFGGAGHDKLFGGNLDDLLLGGSGNDLLYGENGLDRLVGGAGTDQLAGGSQDDQLDGGPGVDTIYGGAGNDTIKVRFDEAVGDVMNGGENIDKIVNDANAPVVLGNFNAATSAVESWVGNDQPILGTDAANVISFQIGASYSMTLSGVPYIDGRGGNDTITGTFGMDYLRGGDGNDVLFGLGGVDVLDGDAGDDSLNGGDGNDYLFGGDGVDTITTGAGRDIVLFSGDAASMDIITDFTLNSDRIVLRGYGVTYAALVFDSLTSPGSTIIQLPGGKKIRLLNWNGVVSASHFAF